MSFKKIMEQGASTVSGKFIALAENDHCDNNNQINSVESQYYEDDIDLTLIIYCLWFEILLFFI